MEFLSFPSVVSVLMLDPWTTSPILPVFLLLVLVLVLVEI
jgi:hypothetical protein